MSSVEDDIEQQLQSINVLSNAPATSKSAVDEIDIGLSESSLVLTLHCVSLQHTHTHVSSHETYSNPVV